MSACSGPPPDARLIARFQSHRPVFDQLRARACGSGHDQTIGRGYEIPSLAPADADWFRRRMDEIGVERLIAYGLGPDCRLELDAWSDAFADPRRRYKRFHFGPRYGVVVDDLDRFKLNDRDVILIRPIDQDWSLEYSRHR